jgi:hypothetical protein
LILGLTIGGFDVYTSIGLIAGSAMLIFGMTFFSIGVDVSVMSIGAVASGPITCAFVLPFALCASTALGGNPLTDAFGAISLVALMPLIAVQTVGLIVAQKQNKLE